MMQKLDHKLQRLQKDLHIDMNFVAAQTEHMYTMMDLGLAPRNYKEVMNSPNKDEWLAAVQLERQALEDLDCFGPPQDLPAGFQATTTSYLFVVKADGRKKARHVFRYTPFNGVYSSEDTYSPVVE